MSENLYTSRTLQSTPAGNIEFCTDEGGNQLNITHPSGSNISFSDELTSTFNPKNSQSLTLGNEFSTVRGDKNNFTQGTLDNRVEGDLVEFVGPSTILSQDLMTEWYKEYGNGIGAIQAQWGDNRESLSDDAFPINPIFVKPGGTGDLTVSPELKDGTLEDNSSLQNIDALEDSMMNNTIIKNSDASKALRENINEQYDGITQKNVDGLNRTFNKKGL